MALWHGARFWARSPPGDGRDGLARALGPVPLAPAPGALIGVEHEYRVLDVDGAPVDFRTLIHTLPIDGLRIDPGDTNAYRLRSGLVLTADDAEAELATPPIATGRGFASEAEAWSARGRRALERLLPAAYHLEGFSTHINVAMPDDLVDEVAVRYLRSFGLALAWLLESPHSLGIYVRPRPGRLELCGDFVDGERLAECVAFAVGSARACAAVIDGRLPASAIPPGLAANILPGLERYGHRLHRHLAFEFDAYTDPRSSEFPLADGSGQTISGALVLRRAWNSARWQLGRELSRPMRRTN